jgi:hypothetical protein
MVSNFRSALIHSSKLGKVNGRVFPFVGLPEATEVMPEYYQLVPGQSARKVTFEVKLDGVVKEVPSDRARDCESRPSRSDVVLSCEIKIVSVYVQRRGGDCKPHALEEAGKKSWHWHVRPFQSFTRSFFMPKLPILGLGLRSVHFC